MRALSSSPSLLPVVALAATLAGCAGDARPLQSPEAPALSRAALAQRPISGVCNTTFVPPAFPPPPSFRQTDDGTCQLSHLGRTAIHSVQVIDLGAGTQTSIEYTYTAANGDVLRAVNVGVNTPSGPAVQFSGTTTFVGGTGRFEHATGQAHIEGSASLMTNTASYTIDGWIAY